MKIQINLQNNLSRNKLNYSIIIQLDEKNYKNFRLKLCALGFGDEYSRK